MLQRILAAMKGPYLEIQELSNNVVSIVAADHLCIPCRISYVDRCFYMKLLLFPQHQQEAPQDVYALVFDESELESLYDALRRQREGLEYITEILT